VTSKLLYISMIKSLEDW